MNDIVNTYFKQFYPTSEQMENSTWIGDNQLVDGVDPIFPRMKCADGFSMSVQGHYGGYCRPRENWAPRYSEVEVGFPSAQEDLLMPFIDDSESPTETVYGYVPISVIEAVLEKHGGLIGPQEEGEQA